MPSSLSGPGAPSVPGGASASAAADSVAPQLVVAFDYGRRRIGVACGDTLSRTARPLAGIVNDSAGPRWDSVAAVLRDWQPALVVVGLPYNTDDTESAMSGAARGFAREIGTRFAFEVRLVDERYSSLEAQARLRSERGSGARKHKVVKADIDAAAACVILERWFFEAH